MFNRRRFLANTIAATGMLADSLSIASAEAFTEAAKLIITGFRGTTTSDPEVRSILRYLEADQIAGVLLLKRNIVSPEQVLKLSLAFREASARVPIIAIDQEGGSIARLDASNGFSDWMSAAEMSSSDMTDEEIFEYYLVRAREMMSVGINLNFGPVLDLNVNPLNPIIGMFGRSFGKTSATVVRLASTFVQVHRAVGIMTCAKHFPGHGSSVSDSHLAVTDINSTWSEEELRPFREMSSLGNLDCLMTSHVILRRFSDDGTRPVSLSRKGVDAARTELGYSGPIVTDDLQMRAITSGFTQEAAAVAAVNAGHTFLVYANYGDEFTIDTAAAVQGALRAALSTGDLELSTLVEQQNVASLFLDRLR